MLALAGPARAEVSFVTIPGDGWTLALNSHGYFVTSGVRSTRIID